MLTLPDFKEKKILFISTFKQDHPSELRLSNGNIRLFKRGKFVDQISCFSVFSVFILGDLSITTKLIKELIKYGISIFFLNSSFSSYAYINSKADGNYLIRQRQYDLTNGEKLEMAKLIVKNKMENQCKLINHTNRLPFVELEEKINLANTIDKLRGIEGAFASKYFKLIFENIGWYRRSPRTKEDIPNLLLDIGYSFTFNFVDCLLQLFGMDTYLGFFHQLYFQRKSLSCDLMEPLRPMIDKQLIKAYHLGQINEKDFRFTKGKYMIKDYKKQTKYAGIFFDILMKNREKIYKYITGFYYHLADPEKYNFKNFKI